MRINIRADDSVEIEGYVNAVERLSKPLNSRLGQFLERICKGAFAKALKRNDNVRILLNHDWTRDLGGTGDGNLELTEDAIGLHARAIITDKEVVNEARRGDLVGWSFGFQDRDVEETQERGLPVRNVKDLDLAEVSLILALGEQAKSPITRRKPSWAPATVRGPCPNCLPGESFHSSAASCRHRHQDGQGL